MGSEFSDFLNILFGVQLGSILGHVLFTIFIADLFFINDNTDFASYADDTTPYVCGQSFSEVIIFLESNITSVFKVFHQNDLTANSSKSHLLISPYEKKSTHILCIKTSFSEALLQIKIDSNLNFYEHITSSCSKVNKKLSALSRVSKYMGINKRRILGNLIFSHNLITVPSV